MSTHRNNKLHLISINAIIMGLYVVLSFILPFSSGAIQFRLSESLNHLVVFNRKLMSTIYFSALVFSMFFLEVVKLY
jgi:uncharacterized membrane protein